MYTQEKSTWLKYSDFILTDMLCIQFALLIAFCFRNGYADVWKDYYYQRMAVTLLVIDVIVVFFCESYKNILFREHFEELKQTLLFSSEVLIGFIIFNYLAKFETDYSRVVIIMMWELDIIFCFLARVLRKRFIKKNASDIRNIHASMLVLTDSISAEKVIDKVKENKGDGRLIKGIILLDRDRTGETIRSIPVVASKSTAVSYLCQNWVDEVLTTYQGKEEEGQVLNDCEEMGITVHRVLTDSFDTEWKKTVENIGGYTVITDSIEAVAPIAKATKRLIDIAGGLVGCVLTGILFLFVAPAIYIKSPGPIFFSQIRIGKNGRRFRIYKFRSMYMDAEKRKKELMEQNKIKDGMMFKMDNDPRIIKGVGNFIRKTSIDEFPQFFNVLKGDMSLVGTRPPTVDEWEKYEKHHRVRMAIKPGLTGMWQVSGRSGITDFEEVVALDTKYIREWSLFLDLRILLKTVKIVITGSGSQ